MSHLHTKLLNKTIMSTPLIDHRNQLINNSSTLYLGNPDIQKKIHWEATKQGSSLVITPEQNDDKSPHELALFTTIVQLSANDFYLTPDTGWTGSSTGNRQPPPFHKIKLSCCGPDPCKGETLRQDFKTTMNIIKSLQAEKTHKNNTVLSIIVSKPNTDDRIKFRHALFKVNSPSHFNDPFS